MSPQLFLSIIEVGCFFSLLALSFLLVLDGAAVFNFAIGPYAMAAGLATSWLVTRLGYPVLAAALAGLAIAVVLAAVTDVAVIRPIEARLGGAELPALVAVAATLFLIEQAAGTIFGRGDFPGQPLLGFEPIALGSAAMSAPQVTLLVATVAVFALVAWWLRASRTGRMLRAVGDNKHAAQLLGLPVSRIRGIAFILSGLIAGLAGLLFAHKSGVSFTSGLQWTLWGFLALVIGGTGSVWAPLIGGMLLAAVQILSPYYFGSAAADYAILLVALLFFALRPSGLITRKVRT
ncbi:MAG: branched-chain amino acid ABC transporter permease [Nocardiopsaceae bacterium]|nr:branched-chain amino acid ABC transporter permease [Nocardiopsaceae bacterium]